LNNKKTSMNDSAYKVLLDKNDVRDPNSPIGNRRQRTRDLLSGGLANRPSLVDQVQQYPEQNPMNYAPQVQQNYQPQHNTFQNYQPQQQLYNPQPQQYQPQFPVPQNRFSNFTAAPFAAPYRPRTDLSSLLNNRRSRESRKSIIDSRSSRDSGRFHSRRRKNRYDISDDDSDDCEQLTPGQKKTVLQLIEEMCPSSMSKVIQQNVLDEMEKLDKKGYRLPKGYDKSKHTMDANEMELFGQQVAKDKDRDRNKAVNFIGMAASGLKWFCSMMHIDVINTSRVPQIISEGIANNEFEDSLEGLGSYLRGTVFEHPLVSSAITFVKKVGDASNEEIEEENEKLAEEQLRREEKTKTPLSSLNTFDKTCFDMAPPKSHKQKNEKKEKSEKNEKTDEKKK
jgi:hypothetical protein